MKKTSGIDKTAKVFVIIIALSIVLSYTTTLAIESNNLLLSKNNSVEVAETSDDFFNILLLGVDFGKPGYYGSGGKKGKHFEDSHTDVVMVVSMNVDKKLINLVSIPRDTVTYVPNVRGIYKLNAAINCAETTEEGIQNTVNAASWLLGGVHLDRYVLVDMNALIALGDAIGGVDFEMDMAYMSGDRKYRKGMQHLDGQGIMDYVRARKNAPIDTHDIGRTNRGRRMIAAILEKLRSDLTLIPKVLAVLNTEKHIYTNLNQEDIPQLIQMAMTMDIRNIGSHVLTGKYLTAMKWNFTFTDQQHRLDVLKEVYGIDAEPIPYVSKKYTQWLEKDGFTYARYIFMAEELLNHAHSVNNITIGQQTLLTQFTTAYEEMIKAYEQAADSMNNADGEMMRKKGHQLRTLGDRVAESFHYTEKYWWQGNNNYWYRDPLINEYSKINWH